MQHFIDQSQIALSADDLSQLLTTIESIDFGKTPTLDHVSNMLRGSVKNFLDRKFSSQQQNGPEVVHYELKRAQDGVFRLFPIGHTFKDEK